MISAVLIIVEPDYACARVARPLSKGLIPLSKKAMVKVYKDVQHKHDPLDHYIAPGCSQYKTGDSIIRTDDLNPNP